MEEEVRSVALGGALAVLVCGRLGSWCCSMSPLVRSRGLALQSCSLLSGLGAAAIPRGRSASFNKHIGTVKKKKAEYTAIIESECIRQLKLMDTSL